MKSPSQYHIQKRKDGRYAVTVMYGIVKNKGDKVADTEQHFWTELFSGFYILQ